MQIKQKHEHTKQLYEKPQLRIIELEAKEVLAEGCKIAGSGTPGQLQPTQCGISNACVADGS